MKIFMHVGLMFMMLTVVNCSSQSIKIDIGGTLDFNQAIKCGYQYGQYFGEESGFKQYDFKRENVRNSSIMDKGDGSRSVSA